MVSALGRVAGHWSTDPLLSLPLASLVLDGSAGVSNGFQMGVLKKHFERITKKPVIPKAVLPAYNRHSVSVSAHCSCGYKVAMSVLGVWKSAIINAMKIAD